MASHPQISTNTPALIDFDSIKKLTLTEANAVDQLIINELSSDVVLINQMGRYIVGSGGKRLKIARRRFNLTIKVKIGRTVKA